MQNFATKLFPCHFQLLPRLREVVVVRNSPHKGFSTATTLKLIFPFFAAYVTPSSIRKLSSLLRRVNILENEVKIEVSSATRPIRVRDDTPFEMLSTPTPTPTSASHLCWPKTPSSSFVLGPENSDAHALCSRSLRSWAPQSPLPDFPPESLRQCSSSHKTSTLREQKKSVYQISSRIHEQIPTKLPPMCRRRRVEHSTVTIVVISLVHRLPGLAWPGLSLCLVTLLLLLCVFFADE